MIGLRQLRRAIRPYKGLQLLLLFGVSLLVYHELPLSISSMHPSDTVQNTLPAGPKPFRSSAFGGSHVMKPHSHVISYDNDWVGLNKPVYLFLYAAHYDGRKPKEKKVVIIGVSDWTRGKPFTAICRMLKGNTTLHIAYSGIFTARGGDATSSNVHSAFAMIRCPLYVKNNQFPDRVKVDLMKGETDLTSVAELPIQYPVKPAIKRQLGACICNLYRPDTHEFPPLEASNVVEWIEMQKVLGVEHFSFYVHSVPVSVYEVLRYYERQGVVTIRSMGPIDGDRYKQPRMTSTVDCMHRYMHSHEKVIVLDIDEVILPRKDITLPELVANLKKEYPTKYHFQFQNVMFFTDIQREDKSKPSYSNFLRNRWRLPPTPFAGPMKSIQDPNVCVLSTNHRCGTFGLPRNESEKHTAFVPWQTAASFHYKECNRTRTHFWDCENELKNITQDDVMLRYEKRLLPAMDRVMQDLSLDV